MKLKSSMKWAIAAAAAVTTVTVSVGMIASAYTYNWDETSGGGYGIFGDGNDKIEKEYFRKGYDFEFSEENSALKQAVRFELSVDIEDYYSNKIFCNIPAKATISFGGYDENGDRVEIGQLVKNEVYSGDLKYSFTDDDKDSMASGKFWMDLEDQSYSSIEFKSIKFYDKDDRCILYGCAQDTSLNEQYWNWQGQWTFYQLKGPRPIISGIQNDDGTYALNAEVTSGGLAMSVETSNNAESDICEFELSNAVQIFTMNGADVTGKQQLAFNSAEGANNEYKFVSGASVVLKDTRNLGADGKPTEIELYSVDNEQTVKIEKMKIKAGEPQLLGELPTISYGDYNSNDELLQSLNNATRDKNFDAPNVEGAIVDSSVTDDTALFSRALIPSADGTRKVIAKVVYDEVSGFDPASHKAQTITLKAHVEANDIEFKDGTVRFEKEMSCSADYINTVKISKLPGTDYEYREDLDLSGGELTITYNSNDTETVSMTDARVSAGGFYGANGEFPAYNSEVEVTVTYTAEDGVYDPDRADGAKFSETFTVSIRDISTLDAPVITPNGGTFRGSVEVSITAQEGATIFYTIDGSDPTANSIKYTAPFTITQGTTVKAVAIKENCHDSEIATAEFTRRSGGGSSGGSRPAASTEPDDPTIGGSSKSWSDIAADIAKLANGSEVTIQLNGNTTVPVEVIMKIADTDSKVTFVIDSVFTWVVDGAKITVPAAADFSFIRTANQKHDSLRGIEGTQFKINNTGVPAGLEIAFKSEHAGKFANLYKSVDGKPVFVTCAKLGADGKVLLPNVTEKGDYIAMLCEFSNLPGDADNDGILSALDASAILKQIVGKAKSANSVMCDFDGNGNVNAMDASAILKRIACLI